MSKLPPFVEVYWFDTVSDSKWRDMGDYPKPAKIRSRGWLVEKEDAHVTLASSLDWEQEEKGCGDVITIPSGCIETLTKLRLR